MPLSTLYAKDNNRRDRRSTTTLGCNVRKTEAAEFKEYVAKQGKTVSSDLKEYVFKCIQK